jgi:hypothetical protein
MDTEILEVLTMLIAPTQSVFDEGVCSAEYWVPSDYGSTMAAGIDSFPSAVGREATGVLGHDVPLDTVPKVDHESTWKRFLDTDLRVVSLEHCADVFHALWIKSDGFVHFSVLVAAGRQDVSQMIEWLSSHLCQRGSDVFRLRRAQTQREFIAGLPMPALILTKDDDGNSLRVTFPLSLEDLASRLLGELGLECPNCEPSSEGRK